MKARLAAGEKHKANVPVPLGISPMTPPKHKASARCSTGA